MAASRGVRLTEGHRDIIATGQLSMNELAGQLGVTRQTLFVNFKRRGWRTTPVEADAAALSSPAGGASPGAPTSSPAKRHQRPASARSPAPASTSPTAPIGAPSDPAAPATVEIRTADELTEHARRAIAAVALAALDQAHAILTRGPVGASALKAAVASSVLAADQLTRCGFDVASVGEERAPRMLIVEMTAAEVEQTRAAVEAEHRENFGTVEDDELDEGEDPDDEADPRQRAA